MQTSELLNKLTVRLQVDIHLTECLDKSKTSRYVADVDIIGAATHRRFEYTGFFDVSFFDSPALFLPKRRAQQVSRLRMLPIIL